METAEFETDSLLKLLTDALRRGPGTPEWHDAIEYLKRDGVAGADEYRLLLTVRERLESGQEYRSVRAGPVFTRELFDKINSDDGAGGGRSKRPITTLVVAVVCLVTLVGSIGFIVNYLSQANFVRGGAKNGEALASQLFLTPVRTWTFTGQIPADLKRAGTMKVEPWGGFRPSREAGQSDAGEWAVVYSDVPLDLAAGPLCVEMQVRYQPGPVFLQMWLGKSGEFDRSGFRASDEWLNLSCEPSGVLVLGGDKPASPRPLPAGVHTLRLKIAGEHAVAELNGQQIWSGRHTLKGQVDVGVQLVKTAKPQGGIGVQSLRVLAP